MADYNEQDNIELSIETQKKITMIGQSDRSALLAKIGQQEDELQQKDLMIEHSKNELSQLREKLRSNIESMLKCSSQFSFAQKEFKSQNKQILALIEQLGEENRVMGATITMWAKRCTMLQFELIAEQESAKSLKVLHENANRRIALLETELKTNAQSKS